MPQDRATTPPAPRRTGDAQLETPREFSVLLVEDDDADAYLIERALSNNPRIAGIVRARDGVEALELVDAQRMRPGLALVDLNMPRKNGFALLSEMRARVTVDFPSVVLTSSRATADSEGSLKRGATQFVTKPASLQGLTAALNAVVAAI